ncbi:hypothetical protein MKW94_004533, partial [Papaver nudicaule]|nr:hypothetical protein [Papaver nudicaule]
ESFDDLTSLWMNRSMDIEDLTYEELLEFAEYGRKEKARYEKETISRNLKTRVLIDSSTSKDTIEEEICIICQ